MTPYTLEETILHLNNVSLGYKDEKTGNDKIILKDVTLTEKNVVRPGFASTGQTIAFLGRSGRGKSTLFKALTGLLQPLSGQVLITDMATDDKQDAKQVYEGDIGFVDQKYTLFRHMTIMQIFKYALRRSTVTPSDKYALIERYLNEWGLIEHKNKYSCELSGGQRQRTAIIEQLLSSRHFMVMDEPFSGLDCFNVERVKQSFERIQNADELNTIIFSTHDLNLAVELADSIYIVGRPDGVEDYSTIIKHYDLKELGLAWQPFDLRHLELVKDIKEVLLKS
jgi:ABC-type multidrug transport system ATPase subunit